MIVLLIRLMSRVRSRQAHRTSSTQQQIKQLEKELGERKQAEEKLRKQLGELTSLHSMAVAAAEASSGDELIERATPIIGEILDSDNFWVGLVDRTASVLRIHDSYQGLSKEFHQQTMPLNQGVIGQIVATGRPWRTPDITHELSYLAIHPRTRSELCVPLKVGELVIGVINVESTQLKAFSADDERLLITLAGQLAAAIDRIRLFESTRRRAEELETLAQIASALGKALTCADMIPVILDLVLNLLAVDGAALTLRDRTTSEAVIELGCGTAVKLTGLRLPPGEGLSGYVMTTGQSYVNNNVQSDLDYCWPDVMSGAQTVACIPLIAQEQTIGALCIGRQRVIDERGLSLLTAISDLAANAIRRAELYEQTEQQLHHVAALRNLDMAITASTDLDITLNVFVDQVFTQLGVDAVDVLLLNRSTQVLEYAAGCGFHTNAIACTHLPLGEGYAGRAALEHRLIHAPDLVKANDFRGTALLAAEGFVVYYAVPLITKGQVEGVLEIFLRTPLHHDPEWLDYLEALATQAAIAIENARLFAETRRLLLQTQEQARQLQQIMDTVPGGIFLLDAERRIMLTNPMAQKYLTLLADAQIGDVLTHLNGRPLEELLQVAPAGLRQELEVAEPSPRIFEVDAWTMETESKAGDWVLVIRDVTREREVQQRIQEQERLAAVGQLAAGIAHDFNNILTGIIGFAELLHFQPNLLQSPEEALERIIQQGRRATHLIRQILDFSRRSLVEKYPISLVSLVKENLKLLERIIPENIHITLNIEPGRESYQLEANPTQIQQVLTNLAVNARDAMLLGGILQFRLSGLTLRADDPPPYPSLSPGDWAVLAIRDTGVGISAEVLPHIFEPFFTTKAVGQGTGLGLAQVYGIVKQHGGEINVASQVGHGTTFTLYLPIVPSSQESLSQTAEQELPHGQAEIILLVEDDSVVLDALEAMLTALRYQVLTAHNGEQAVEVYDEQKDEIALVLTDVTMPEMGGMTLAQILQEQNPMIKMVAMSGYPLEEAKDARSQGFVAWLQKPTSIEQLAQVVSRALK